MFKKDDAVEILVGIEDLQIERGDIAYIVGDCMNLGCVVIKFDNGYECKFKKDDLKLVEEKKEEKMKKIVVRGWEDLYNFFGKNEMYGTTISQIEVMTVKYAGFNFTFENHGNEDEIEKTIKVLNALGGNFEYKPVEVIDTLEKWEEFQKLISNDGYIFDRYFLMFQKFDKMKGSLHVGQTTKEVVEKEYNVDLKILK